MSYSKTYPALFQFLGSWFPDSDFEGLSDSQVAEAFLDTPNDQEHVMVRCEINALISSDETLPWQDIAKEANRYFHNEEECYAWLVMIRDKLSR